MAFDDKLKITFQDANDNYYYATQATDGTWAVSITDQITYIKHLPENWDTGTVITWQRDMKYGGVFRSMTDKYIFVMDARAILQLLMFGSGGIGGVNAFCKMTIWLFNDSGIAWNYGVLYPSHIDFTKYNDDAQLQKLSIGTLDNGLYKFFESKRDVVFNIPYWTYDPDGGVWNTDAKFVNHDGIKLFWQGNWVSGAKPTENLIINSANGFHHGKHGSDPNDGYHTLFSMSQYNEIQNNGATTTIGADILNPFLKQGTQSHGIDFPSELNFAGTNESRPYTTNSFCLKNLLPDLDGNPTGSIEMKIGVRGKFEGALTIGASGTNQYLSFVLFEIDNKDQATETSPGSGLWSYIEGIRIPLPDAGGVYTPPDSGNFSNYGSLNSITLNYGKVYAFGGVWDNDAGTTNGIDYNLSSLEFKVFSKYTSGTTAPIDAPRYPRAIVAAFSPIQVLQKLMNVFDSTESDARGFPIPTGVGYIGTSDFLSDTGFDPATNYDLIPANVWYTTENVLSNASGVPFMSISLTDFHSTWFGINMVGLGIDGEDTIRMERMPYFFDAATEILNLGDTLAWLKVKPHTDIMGNRLKVGYGDLKTNSDFGGDNYNFAQEYTLQMDTMPKELNYSVTSAITEINEIQKRIAQNNNGSGDPSTGNNNVLLEVAGSGDTTVDASDPSGITHSVSAFPLQKYPTAQSTDPSAAIEPYINGTKFPDACYNFGLSPAKNLRRLGAFIRGLCDQMFAGVVSFRKQYEMQYNDALTPPTALPGISTNLNGILIQEAKDVAIIDLDAPLYRPYIFSFECQYPVNMYSLINSNPRGYVSFTYKGVQRKGFIYRVEQSAGNNAATTFELLAHPDTTDAELRPN